MPDSPFDLSLPSDTPLRRAVSIAARPLLSWLVGARTYGVLYHRAEARRGTTRAADRLDGGAAAYAAGALDVLDIHPDCSGAEIGNVPARGPLIVAANHPHGALDGLVLLDTVGRVRPDVRLIANRVLSRVPELRDFCFFVDPFERSASSARSLSGLRSAHLWLRHGGAIIIFPAGEVAHVQRPDGSVAESAWRSTVGRLAASTGATIVPAHIGGSNSRMFYAAGRLHPILRTALLPRELLKSRGCSVRVRLGHPFTTGDDPCAERTTERIRQGVEQLRAGGTTSQAMGRLKAAPTNERRSQPAPTEAPREAQLLACEVARLPESALMAEAGALRVFCADAQDIPTVLAEIGRLRELTYRAVGEGTGRPSDLDRFDARYLHLFLWHPQRREIAGAYRVGRTDLIVASAGVEGLYTRTLFQYDRQLLERLPPALELGRSFVRSEYQRTPSALMLLWKGICAFVARHAQYRVLFGAVSISDRYSDRTREMLMRFLVQNHLEHSLSSLISSIHPYSSVSSSSSRAVPVPRSVEEADALVAELEHRQGGMPVLLRQYLKLNARLLGFNVDPDFGDALDALMMVDLTRVDHRILRRYFGPAAAGAYLGLAALRSASDAA